MINSPAWNHGINVVRGCGYVPKGIWHIDDTGSDTLLPFIHVGSDRSDTHIFGTGDSSVIVMDATVPDTMQFVFLIDGDRVTVESMKLVGTGYGEPSGRGGIAISFGQLADSGIVRHVTTVNWGTAGIATYDSRHVLIEHNTIIADGSSYPMGIWVHGSIANAAVFSGDTVRGNHVRYAGAEGIIVLAHSGVVVDSNTVDSCTYGIVLNGGHDAIGSPWPGGHADSNLVRHNLVRWTGNPSAGYGIFVVSNASYNVIDSNSVESTHEHDAIHVSYSGTNRANRIQANTIDGVGLNSSDSDLVGILNSGLETVIDHNGVTDAPFGIVNTSQGTASVTYNSLSDITTGIRNSGLSTVIDYNSIGGATTGIANGESATASVTFNTLTDNYTPFSNDNGVAALSPFCGNSLGGIVNVPCQHIATVTISGTIEAPPDSMCVFVGAAGEGPEQFTLRWYVGGDPQQVGGATFHWTASSAYAITLVASDAYGATTNAYHSVGMNPDIEGCNIEQRPNPSPPSRTPF